MISGGDAYRYTFTCIEGIDHIIHPQARSGIIGTELFIILVGDLFQQFILFFFGDFLALRFEGVTRICNKVFAAEAPLITAI